jgi:formylglycine-generating enzyme required for sulfatase activity
MIKNTFTLILLLLFFLSVFSQEADEMHISGKPKKLDTGEMVARRDADGNFCAAIQVISDMTGFSYDSWNGVVGDVESKPGKDMVFLTASERVLEIFKEGYKPLQIILSDYGINLKPREVWQIEIAGDQKAETLPVVIHFTPEDAQLFIDGNNVYPASNYNLTTGIHQIRITKEGYNEIVDQVEVNVQNKSFDYSLKSYVDFNYELVLVEGGTFIYGCTGEQLDCDEFDQIQQRIAVGNFYIGKYEVTLKEWNNIADDSLSQVSECSNCPVVNIRWVDVQRFIELLNEKTGLNYRLPTEAEWEFAARGGLECDTTRYAGADIIDEVAWYDANSSNCNIVGKKRPNELGIYDMTGNVWEWTCKYHGNNKVSYIATDNYPQNGDGVLRGGGFNSFEQHCRIANRVSAPINYCNDAVGFRLVLTIKDTNFKE